MGVSIGITSMPSMGEVSVCSSVCTCIYMLAANEKRTQGNYFISEASAASHG